MFTEVLESHLFSFLIQNFDSETFRSLNQMAKSIKDLKKENTFLKSKSEKSDITLIELANEVKDFAYIHLNEYMNSYICCLGFTHINNLFYLHEQREILKKQLEKTRNQKEKLESLCRSLQAERKTNSGAGSSSDSIPA